MEEKKDEMLLQGNHLTEEKAMTYRRQLFQIPPSHSIDITFENLSLQIPLSNFSKSKQSILKGISGSFKSGELTAIMGPSGAGKSSLLNALSGFIKSGVSGDILAYNVMEQRRMNEIKKYSAYILQEDHFLPFFTTMELMIHAANLKLGPRISNYAKMTLIDNILDSMSLKDAMNTRCHKLSGGERKRLNLCLELIDNPPVLFLDEPTSGLDSWNCKLLVSELRGLALAGRTVICTIHQPSAALLAMFDHLYFLVDGRCMYQGDTDQLITFLDYINLPCPIYHNPADFVMDVMTEKFDTYEGKFVVALKSRCWRVKTSITNNKTFDSVNLHQKNRFKNINLKPQNKISELEKYTYIVPQLIKQLHRDWVVSYLKMVMNIVIGGLVGILFQGSGNTGEKIFPNLSYLSNSLTYLSFVSIMPIALKFPFEMNVLKKEHFNNWYKFKTYFLAYLTVNIPLQALLTFLYVVVSYFLTSQPLQLHRFFIVLLACVDTSIIAASIGFCMGTLGPTPGVFLGSVVVIVVTLMSGSLLRVKDLPLSLYIASYFSFQRHAYESMVFGVYGMQRENLPCLEDQVYCHFRSPKVVFKYLGLVQEELVWSVVILGALTLITTICAFFILRRSLKDFTKS